MQDDRALSRRHALAGVLGGLAVVAGSACSNRASGGEAAGAAPTLGRRGSTANTSPGPATTTARVPTPTTTLAPPAPIDRDPDVHLLRRLTYGPTEDTLAELRAVGARAWLDGQLDPAGLDTAELDGDLLGVAPQLGMAAGEILAEYRADGNGAQLAGILAISALARHIRSPAQLHERMVEFWSDHFNVPQTNPASTAARIAMDRDVFRVHALGNFDDLLVATAASPAMLLYLNNFQSSVGSINENYAREVLELHTVGVDGGYDEDDIGQVARLLTGWTITRDLEFRFVAADHDPSPVDVLGWQRPSTGDAVDHGEEFLRHLARLPETARHVSQKLAVRFVADDPDPALVDAMAEAWIEHDTAIAPVVKTMAEHPSFSAAPGKFNRPWDYLVQTLRSLETTIDVGFPLDLRRAYGAIQDLGQVPFRWPSPDGYADDGSAWMNAGGVLARWNFAGSVTLEDELFRTGLADRLRDLRGSTATEIYQRLTAWLRLDGPSVADIALFTELTGWAADHVPADAEVDEAGRYVAFVLTAGPTAHFR